MCLLVFNISMTTNLLLPDFSGSKFLHNLANFYRILFNTDCTSITYTYCFGRREFCLKVVFGVSNNWILLPISTIREDVGKFPTRICNYIFKRFFAQKLILIVRLLKLISSISNFSLLFSTRF